MRFDIWKWLVTKDDFILSVIEILASARSLWGILDWRARKAGLKVLKEHKVNGGNIAIVLNAPSIRQQPIERLQGTDCMFVNQGFRHPAYKQIKPKFHVFIDTKLIHGVWDIKWLDEILDMVPDITFILPASWAKLPLLKPYIERKIPIIWLWSSTGGVRGLGVSGACFEIAETLGYSNIYFTGFEATSFAASLLKTSSHFYGNDSDESLMTDSDIMKGYYMNARQIRELILIAKRFEKKKVKVINLTKGGVLAMFKRGVFEEVFCE